MTKTKGYLSEKTGLLPNGVAVNFEKIGGYNHIGRWLFRVNTNSDAFAVEFVPKNLRHSRVLSFSPIKLPIELEKTLSEFSTQLLAQKPTTKYVRRTLRTPIDIIRCTLSMLNNETMNVNQEALSEVERVVYWIFQNPSYAVTVADKNGKWYYNHPILGNFYITEIPA